MIGSKTLLTTFFVIEGKGAYSLLLGRDWIHACTKKIYSNITLNYFC
jgi:hypothetical protein